MLALIKGKRGMIMKTIIITLLLISSQAFASGKINFHNMIEDSVKNERQLKKEVSQMIIDSDTVNINKENKRVADKIKRTDFARSLDSLQK